MKLLAQYHSLENVLENADNIGGKMGEKIKAGRENAILSKELATIITDVPVTFHEENFCIKDCDKGKLTDIFTELEFKTLGRRILGEGFASNASPDAKPKVVQTDLFGAVVAQEIIITTEITESTNILLADKNIHNTPHHYD